MDKANVTALRPRSLNGLLPAAVWAAFHHHKLHPHTSVSLLVLQGPEATKGPQLLDDLLCSFVSCFVSALKLYLATATLLWACSADSLVS